MARYPYREIVEMRSTGLTEAKVAHVCGVTPARVGAVTRAAERLGICWPVPPELGDDELERLLDRVEHFRKFQPDFPAIREAIGVRKLKRKHLKHVYAVYLEMAEEAGGDPYTESTFAVHLGNWAAVAHPEVWWRCDLGHAWRTTVANRTAHDAGCPVCAKRKAVAGVNDLATTHRKLLRQWHPTLNGDLKPKDVTSISSKKVWWRCKSGHEWQAIVSRRAGEHDPGCPYCAGRRAWPGFNDLATLRPDLAAEWHPFRNGKLTPADVTPGSNKTVWWRAGCGHVFELKVCVRSKAKSPSCPYCSGKKVPERPIGGIR